MRLGYGEYYDGKDEENSARQYARHHYFNVVLENDPELLEALRQGIYPIFQSFPLKPGCTVTEWLQLKVCAGFARALEKTPPQTQRQHKERIKMLHEMIYTLSGGTPNDALKLHGALLGWQNQGAIAKLGDWALEIAYRYLGHWADLAVLPSQAQFCSPEEMMEVTLCLLERHLTQIHLFCLNRSFLPSRLCSG